MARVACSKGDSRQVQIIDAARLLPVLSEISRTWRPSQPIPADLDRSWRFIQDHRDALLPLVDRVVREEREQQVKRYYEVVKYLSAEDDLPEVIAAKRGAASLSLRSALDAAVSAGVLQGVQNATLREKLDEFDAVDFQRWAESIQRVIAEQDAAQLLVELSLVPVKAAHVASELLEIGEAMITRTEAAVKRGLTDDYQGVDALVDAQRAIGNGLNRLIQSVTELVSAERG